MKCIGLKKARSRALKRRNRIGCAVEAGDLHLARHRMWGYLRSFDAKLAATAQAFRKMHPGAKLPKAKLAEIAAQLSPWKGTKEPARVSARRKSSDGYRTVVDFELENRALQYLVRGALRPWAERHPRMPPIRYAGHRFPRVVIQRAVRLHLRFTLSHRDAEEAPARRGHDVSHETARRRAG